MSRIYNPMFTASFKNTNKTNNKKTCSHQFSFLLKLKFFLVLIAAISTNIIQRPEINLNKTGAAFFG